MTEHERMMRLALEEAALAATEGEIPVGAVLTRNGEIIARDHNRRESLCEVRFVPLVEGTAKEG